MIPFFMRGGLVETVNSCYHEDMRGKIKTTAAFKYLKAGKEANSEPDNATYNANQASKVAKMPEWAGPSQEKRAGEKHLKAAAAHEKAGNLEKAAQHKEIAAGHAAAAGDEWDEGKHPRDENGKFA